MLKPCTTKTFQNYADLIFIPYVKSQLQTADRVDIVWDIYIPDSLKTETRHSIFLLPIGANQPIADKANLAWKSSLDWYGRDRPVLPGPCFQEEDDTSSSILQVMSSKVARKFVYEQLTQMS